MSKQYTQEELNRLLGIMDEEEREQELFPDYSQILEELKAPVDPVDAVAADSTISEESLRPLGDKILQNIGAPIGRALNVAVSPLKAADELAGRAVTSLFDIERPGGDTPLADIFSGKEGPFISENVPLSEIKPGEEGFLTAANIAGESLRDSAILAASAPYAAYALLSRTAGTITANSTFAAAQRMGLLSRELKTSSDIAANVANLQNVAKAEILNVPVHAGRVGRTAEQTRNFLRRAATFVEDLPITAIRSQVSSPVQTSTTELTSIGSGLMLGLTASNLFDGMEGGNEVVGVLGSAAGSVLNLGTLVNWAASNSNVFRKIYREFGGEADRVRAVHVLDEWISEINSSITERALARGVPQEEVAGLLVPDVPQTLNLFRESLTAVEKEFPDLAGVNNLPPSVVIQAGSRLRGLSGEALGRADRAAEALESSYKAVSREAGSGVASQFAEATGERLSSFQASAFNLAEELASSGNPADLALANKLRAEAMQEFLQKRVVSAQGRIARIVTGVAPTDVPLTGDPILDRAALTKRIEEAGVAIGNILDEAWSEIRQVEAIMFANRATGAIVVEDSLAPLREAYDAMTTRLGPEAIASMGNTRDIQAFIRPGAEVTDTQLVNTRTLIGEEITNLSKGPKRSSVRVAELIRLQDAIDEALGGVSPQLAAAREWKKVSSDTFIRSFGGELQETTARGVDKIRPEDIIWKAYRFSEQDRVPFRMNEIKDAAAVGDISREFGGEVRTLQTTTRDAAAASESLELWKGEYDDFHDFVKNVLGYDTKLADSINNEAQTALRAVVARFIDDNGNFNARKFSTFVTNNSSILSDHPEIREAVTDIRGAQLYYDKVVARKKGIDKITSNQMAYSSVIGINDPVTEMSRHLSRNMTERDFRGFASAATRAERLAADGVAGGVSGAVAGMEAVMVQGALQAARRGGKFSWRAFHDIMFSPNMMPSTGDTRLSVADAMLKYKIIDEDRLTRLRNLTDIAMRTESDLINPEMVLALSSSPTDQLSMWQNLAAGGIGSVLATRTASAMGLLGSGSSGPSLVIASGGAKIMRHFTSETLDESVYRAMMMGLSSAEGFDTLTRVTFNSNQERLSKWNTMVIEAGMEYLSPTYSSEGALDAALNDLDARLNSVVEDSNIELELEELPEIPDLPTMYPEEDEEDFFDQLQ